jgi:WD40 repeat protein
LLRFSPNGKALFADGRFYRLFDVKAQTARIILKNYKGGKPVVAFDPKGKLLAAGVQNPYPYLTFALWDGNTDEKVATCQGHTKSVIDMTFSSDCKIVASAAWDRTIRLWETASGKCTSTFTEQPGTIVCLAFSPNGRVLAVSSLPAANSNKYPGTIRLLAVPSGKLLATLEGHRRTIGRLVFSPNGRLLATGDGEGKIKLWELPRHYATDRGTAPTTKNEGTR